MPKKAKEKETEEVLEEELENEDSKEKLEELIENLQTNIPESGLNIPISSKSTPVLEEITEKQLQTPVFFRTEGREKKEDEEDSVKYKTSSNYGEETSDTKYDKNNKINGLVHEAERIDFQSVGTDIRNPNLKQVEFIRQEFTSNKKEDYVVAPGRFESTDPFGKPQTELGRISEEKTKKYEVK